MTQPIFTGRLPPAPLTHLRQPLALGQPLVHGRAVIHLHFDDAAIGPLRAALRHGRGPAARPPPTLTGSGRAPRAGTPGAARPKAPLPVLCRAGSAADSPGRAAGPLA